MPTCGHLQPEGTSDTGSPGLEGRSEFPSAFPGHGAIHLSIQQCGG